MRTARRSMATMIRAGTRKVRIYSWSGGKKARSASSVGSKEQYIKVTIDVIFCILSFKEGHARITTLPFKL